MTGRQIGFRSTVRRMTDPLHPLASDMAIRAKLKRAWDHLDSLYAKTDAFSDTNPYTIVLDHQESDGKVWVYVLRVDRPFPMEWSAIFGEIVHNCRSALEQAVYRLALENTAPANPEGTGFPIFGADDANWEARGLPQIKRLGQPVQDYIRSFDGS